MTVDPSHVHHSLSKHMLVDGFDFVIDLDKSSGNRFHDAKSGKNFLDFFSCFASMPLGWNHPDMLEKQSELGRIAINNIANSDLYTKEMAWAVDVITNQTMPEHMNNFFMIAGGALAVENTMKVAMDWKMHDRQAKGLVDEKSVCGRKGFCWGAEMRESSKISIGHFKEAFHGRSGYTMSTTNTDPNKTSNFIKFNWPRFNNPKINFPLDEEENARLDRLESSVIHDIREYGENHPDTIAGIIIEPIQGEGGDNHFRPEFMRNLCDVTHEIGAKFIVDEVQTGTGGTGKMWAYEHAGIKPDMLAFGKRMQVCGLMASDSMREYEDNPFQTSSRINSTWGGNLIDMVRSAWQLEVMDKEKLVENAAKRGDELLKGLNELEQKYSFISNVRGKGVLCAFSLENNSQRNQMREAIYKSGSLVLNSGFESIRLRPSLTLSSDEIGEALNMFDAAAQSLSSTLVE